MQFFTGKLKCWDLQIKQINPYSAGIDFSRKNLTSVDVRFWRLKSIPALWEYKYL